MGRERNSPRLGRLFRRSRSDQEQEAITTAVGVDGSGGPAGEAPSDPVEALKAAAEDRGAPVISGSPEDLSVDLAVDAFQQGKPEVADDILGQLIEEGSPQGAAKAQAVRGQMLRERGDLQGAEAAYRAAVDGADPDSAAAAALNLGNMLHERGDREGASRMWTRAMASNHPDAAPIAANSLAAYLVQAGEFDRASQLVQHAIDSGHRDESVGGRLLLGTILTNMGRLEDARAEYHAVAESGHAQFAVRAQACLDELSQPG